MLVGGLSSLQSLDPGGWESQNPRILEAWLARMPLGLRAQLLALVESLQAMDPGGWESQKPRILEAWLAACWLARMLRSEWGKSWPYLKTADWILEA